MVPSSQAFQCILAIPIQMSLKQNMIGFPSQTHSIHPPFRQIHADFCVDLDELIPSPTGPSSDHPPVRYDWRFSSLATLSTFLLLEHFTSLDLSHIARLVDIPRELLNCANLTELNLTGCRNLRSQRLPGCLAQLRKLESLIADRCEIILVGPSSLGNT